MEKSEQERGFYLTPELFGASPDKNLTWRLQGALQAPDYEQLSVQPELDMANVAALEGTAELPDLSANAQIIEKTAEELYALPELEQEPSTDTGAAGVEAP